jgi:hypothetical protein
LLATVHAVESVVDIEHDALWHLSERGQYCSISARPRRNSARVSGRFSSREIVDCEHIVSRFKYAKDSALPLLTDIIQI